MAAFKVFDTWFAFYKENKLAVPTNFNPHVLLNVMHVLFQTQESLATTQVLYFWYEYCTMFDKEVNAYFLSVLVRLYFFKLAMHWSKSVREGFYYLVFGRCLLMYELDEGNELFDTCFLTMNQYLNVLKAASEIYGQRMFTLERMPKKDRRKVLQTQLKADVVRQVEGLNRSTLDQNFLVNIPKFRRPFQNYLQNFQVPNDYFATKDHRVIARDGPVAEDLWKDDEDYKRNSSIRFVRNTVLDFENLKLSHVGVDDIQYAAIGLTDFRNQMSNYQRLKDLNEKLTIDSLPKLKMKLPIDEFEFIDDASTEW